MIKILKYYNFLLWIPLSLILFSCEQIADNQTINYLKDLKGDWKIEESLSTNGPICYFLDKGNTVSFEVSESEMGLYFNYYTGDLNRRDYFQYMIIGDSISGMGSYATNDLPELMVDTTLEQYLEIKFLSEKRIHCKLKLQVYEPKTRELVVGDVSNFYAIKP